MKKEHNAIIELISKFLEEQPEQRFGQALFNLGVNEFQQTNDPRNPNYNIRDIHNDNDTDILKRIERQLEWFELQKKVSNGISNANGLKGMTVNERLFHTDLMDLFDKYKRKNKEYARYILKAIKIDSDSIEKILK